MPVLGYFTGKQARSLTNPKRTLSLESFFTATEQRSSYNVSKFSFTRQLCQKIAYCMYGNHLCISPCEIPLQAFRNNYTQELHYCGKI